MHFKFDNHLQISQDSERRREVKKGENYPGLRLGFSVGPHGEVMHDKMRTFVIASFMAITGTHLFLN